MGLVIHNISCRKKIGETCEKNNFMSYNCNYHLVFPKLFHADTVPTTGYVGGAIRMSIDVSNFNPRPTFIAWNYRGQQFILDTDKRFAVLPQGVLHMYGLTPTDKGEIRAIVKSMYGNRIITGQFAKLTVKPGKKFFY